MSVQRLVSLIGLVISVFSIVALLAGLQTLDLSQASTRLVEQYRNLVHPPIYMLVDFLRPLGVTFHTSALKIDHFLALYTVSAASTDVAGFYEGQLSQKQRLQRTLALSVLFGIVFVYAALVAEITDVQSPRDLMLTLMSVVLGFVLGVFIEVYRGLALGEPIARSLRIVLRFVSTIVGALLFIAVNAGLASQGL